MTLNMNLIEEKNIRKEIIYWNDTNTVRSMRFFKNNTYNYMTWYFYKTGQIFQDIHWDQNGNMGSIKEYNQNGDLMRYQKWSELGNLKEIYISSSNPNQFVYQNKILI